MAGMQSFHLLPAALAANIVFAPSLRCRCIAWLPKRQAASPSNAAGQAHAFDGNGLISLRCTKLRQSRRRKLKRCLGRAVLVLRRRCGVSDFETISGQKNNRIVLAGLVSDSASLAPPVSSCGRRAQKPRYALVSVYNISGADVSIVWSCGLGC